MTAVHYHYMNGSSGCLPDSSDIYNRRCDAIAWAEQLFGDTLCKDCFRNMSKMLRTRSKKMSGWLFYFDRSCEKDAPSGGKCSSGADYVEITKEPGALKTDRYGDVVEGECPCQ